jgi:hypothetical protein
VVYVRAERAFVVVDRIATARPAGVQLLFHSCPGPPGAFARP